MWFLCIVLLDTVLGFGVGLEIGCMMAFLICTCGRRWMKGSGDWRGWSGGCGGDVGTALVE
jgi:hypothetical protein